MKSLGMSFQEVGAIYGVSSVAAILSPFLLGLIADKLGNFKVISIRKVTLIKIQST